jgi:hypothetical protein
MSQCSNCKKNLSCGCQRKVASDKKSVCNNCITAYEASLGKKVNQPIPSQPPAPSNKFSF